MLINELDKKVKIVIKDIGTPHGTIDHRVNS